MTTTQEQVLALEPTAHLVHGCKSYGSAIDKYWVNYAYQGHDQACTTACSPTAEEAWTDALRVFETRLWQQALDL